MANKFNAKKVLIDGIMFDSKKEAKRFCYLKELEDAGAIENLKCHEKFVLFPPHKKSDGTTERAATYTADFVYYKDGDVVVEDVKGYRKGNPAYASYVIKRKAMLHLYGIEVKEI